jgi:phosphatidylglycerophosphate synthase
MANRVVVFLLSTRAWWTGLCMARSVVLSFFRQSFNASGSIGLHLGGCYTEYNTYGRQASLPIIIIVLTEYLAQSKEYSVDSLQRQFFYYFVAVVPVARCLYIVASTHSCIQ